MTKQIVPMFVALACTAAFAQTDTSRQASQKGSKTDTVTVTGCVAEGTGGRFMLNNAMMSHGMSGSTAGSTTSGSATSGSATSGSATSGGGMSGSSATASYTLTGGDNLKAHVGHKVEVTGTLSGNARGGAMSGGAGSTSSGAGSSTSGSATSGSMSGSSASGQELHVQSVKMVSATCP